MRQLVKAAVILALLAPGLCAQPEDSLIAISADIVEIAGSNQRDVGFVWGPFQTGINFAEQQIPGIYTIGDFARQTALQASLKMLETEGKAQLLSNPKVIVQAGADAASFIVGDKLPFPVCGNQGCTAEFKDAGTILNIAPVINPNKKETIRATFQLEVSNPDFSKAVQIGNATVPTIVTRQLQSTVELKSGETLVIGGLKSSRKNVSKTRVPFLGRIPILGLLFTTTSIIEEQKSLFLFITMEIVK
ncbi:MAG: type II and III secretion system protein [Elusimicrobia bacterium]|nr:type II and III secretion system protein [Elusimicrobiota bacterium]